MFAKVPSSLRADHDPLRHETRKNGVSALGLFFASERAPIGLKLAPSGLKRAPSGLTQALTGLKRATGRGQLKAGPRSVLNDPSSI